MITPRATKNILDSNYLLLHHSGGKMNVNRTTKGNTLLILG